MDRNTYGFLSAGMLALSMHITDKSHKVNVPRLDDILNGTAKSIKSPDDMDCVHPEYLAAQCQTMLGMIARLQDIHDEARGVTARKKYYQSLSNALEFAGNNFHAGYVGYFILILRDHHKLEFKTSELRPAVRKWLKELPKKIPHPKLKL